MKASGHGAARSGSGARCGRCSPRPGSNAAGSTRSQTSLAALPRPAHPGAKKALTEIWNPIESTFATVRHRTKVTKGPGSKAAGLAMAFKLIEAAQGRWRAVNAPHLVALVRNGAVFKLSLIHI